MKQLRSNVNRSVRKFGMRLVEPSLRFRRDLLLIAGDLNSTVGSLRGLVGKGVLASAASSDPEQITWLEAHRLCVLNSWGSFQTTALCHLYKWGSAYADGLRAVCCRSIGTQVSTAGARSLTLETWL